MEQQEIELLRKKIDSLTAKLIDAKSDVAKWTEANKSLSLSAASARAKNQGAGRGFIGGLMGSKFRSAIRAGAVASNTAISREVADKRAQISDGKKVAQDRVREIQSELAEAKLQLKVLTSREKKTVSIKQSATKRATESLDLLQKLKNAKDSGLLTHEEFEEKRKKLIDEL
ncbi:MAG: SHOCT domain-containing protein [Syntrophaceae bacterium]|nr:SHOCT domain-containing protein [Syntrophaceae bacterium]